MKVAEKAKGRSGRVRLRRPATKVGLGRKLRKDWYAEPYEIVQENNKSNAEININGKRQWVHINRLKKAEWSREDAYTERLDDEIQTSVKTTTAVRNRSASQSMKEYESYTYFFFILLSCLLTLSF